MRRNPLYVLKSEHSVGIFDIPLHSVIQILQTDEGRVLVIELIAKTDLNAGSTVGEVLDNADLYNILSDGTPGGELVKYIQQGITGYKLIDFTIADYGPVGLNSIDFSFQNVAVVPDGGTTGDYSFATGMYNKAVGMYSAAFGYQNEANGTNSFVIGRDNIARGGVTRQHHAGRNQ